MASGQNGQTGQPAAILVEMAPRPGTELVREGLELENHVKEMPLRQSHAPLLAPVSINFHPSIKLCYYRCNNYVAR